MSAALAPRPPHPPALATLACACVLVAHALNAGVETSPRPLPLHAFARPTARAEPPPAPIERERVLVRQGERVAQLGFGPVSPAAPPAPTGTPALGAGIREVGPHAYVLPREELRRALAQPEQLMTQARLVPSFNGVDDGFKLYSIRPESLFARLGLANGDRVVRLNGLAMSGVENVLEAYARLPEASHFQLELERNGQPVRKTYTVSD